MDLNEEFCVINQAISEVQASQDEIMKKLQINSLYHSEKIKKDIEVLESTVDSLENQIGKQTSAFHAVNKLAIELLGKVENFKTKLEMSNCVRESNECNMFGNMKKHTHYLNETAQACQTNTESKRSECLNQLNGVSLDESHDKHHTHTHQTESFTGKETFHSENQIVNDRCTDCHEKLTLNERFFSCCKCNENNSNSEDWVKSSDRNEVEDLNEQSWSDTFNPSALLPLKTSEDYSRTFSNSNDNTQSVELSLEQDDVHSVDFGKDSKYEERFEFEFLNENEIGLSVEQNGADVDFETDSKCDERLEFKFADEYSQNDLGKKSTLTFDKLSDHGIENILLGTKDSSCPSVGNETNLANVLKHDCVYRNDFGYKRKECDFCIDNRTYFYNRKPCYQGQAIVLCDESPVRVESPSNTNIVEPLVNIEALMASEKECYKPDANEDYTALDRMLAESLAAEDEMPSGNCSESFGSETNGPKSFGFEPQIMEKPSSMHDWMSYAEQLRKDALVKRETNTIRRSRRGHDYVLVLDCSERMIGQKFITMIKAARDYVNGIKHQSLFGPTKDNIGLAVFGGTSTLLSPPTCNYDMLISKIDGLKPQGEAPLVGGLLMGLAGAFGSGSQSGFGGYVFQPYVIIFTDNQSQNISTVSGFSVHHTYLTGTTHMEAQGVIEQMADAYVRVYYVPVEENGQNQVMEMALRSTKGKLIKPFEMHRLVGMTKMLHLATSVASDVRFIRPRYTRELVKSKIAQRSYNSIDQHEDCVDLVMELLMSTGGFFNEVNCRTLSLGDRVRRGPNWVFENQDSGLPGTVIGKRDSSNVFVEWDSGYINYYFYGKFNGNKSIRKIQEYRRVADGMVAVGCRVMRGKDWTYGDEDGGGQGTVLKVSENGSIVVRWDNRKIGQYRMGQDGLLEVKLCDTFNFTMGSRNAINSNTERESNFNINPDRVNEDDIINNGCNRTDVKFNHYIIPVNTNAKDKDTVWEFRENDEWIPFSRDIQKRLEKFYSRNRKGKAILEIDSKLYQIDLGKMKRTDSGTQQEVDIRRINLRIGNL